MLKLIKKIFKIGIVTEKFDCKDFESEQLITTGSLCKKIIDAKFNSSLAIRHVDAGSCNGCELEIHALNNAFYDIERFGIYFVASPRHADLLLVTGPVTKHMEAALLSAFKATPSPKLVIATGDCGVDGGEFSCSYACVGAISKVIPVDAYIRGCPPTPLQLLQGILQLIGKK
jgi:Ni,Fe-hydrogenase III small subunit